MRTEFLSIALVESCIISDLPVATGMILQAWHQPGTRVGVHTRKLVPGTRSSGIAPYSAMYEDRTACSRPQRAASRWINHTSTIPVIPEGELRLGIPIHNKIYSYRY